MYTWSLQAKRLGTPPSRCAFTRNWTVFCKHTFQVSISSVWGLLHGTSITRYLHNGAFTVVIYW